MTVYILRDGFAAMPPLRKRGGYEPRPYGSQGGDKPTLKTFNAYPLGHNRHTKGKKWRAYAKRV